MRFSFSKIRGPASEGTLLRPDDRVSVGFALPSLDWLRTSEYKIKVHVSLSTLFLSWKTRFDADKSNDYDSNKDDASDAGDSDDEHRDANGDEVLNQKPCQGSSGLTGFMVQYLGMP